MFYSRTYDQSFHKLDEVRGINCSFFIFRFAAIGQSDIGEQLRAALTEGYSADDEAPGI